MAQKPIAKEVAHRFAELVGRGLIQHEAARAVGIGTRTGERLMTNSEIRQIVEQSRTARSELVGEPYERRSRRFSKPPPRTETRIGRSAWRVRSWR